MDLAAYDELLTQIPDLARMLIDNPICLDQFVTTSGYPQPEFTIRHARQMLKMIVPTK